LDLPVYLSLAYRPHRDASSLPGQSQYISHINRRADLWHLSLRLDIGRGEMISEACFRGGAVAQPAPTALMNELTTKGVVSALPAGLIDDPDSEVAHI
jgi:hypothetical protein